MGLTLTYRLEYGAIFGGNARTIDAHRVDMGALVHVAIGCHHTRTDFHFVRLRLRHLCCLNSESVQVYDIT